MNARDRALNRKAGTRLLGEHHPLTSIGMQSKPCAASDRAGAVKSLKQAVHTIEIQTRGKGLYEFTSRIDEWVQQQGMQAGLLTVFCRHTSASLLIQENADPTVQSDIRSYFDRIAPDDGPYVHNYEGPDDMPAHLKTALTQVQLSIPFVNGALTLGTWQGVYLFEHRLRPHRREIVLHLIGE